MALTEQELITCAIGGYDPELYEQAKRPARMSPEEFEEAVRIETAKLAQGLAILHIENLRNEVRK